MRTVRTGYPRDRKQGVGGLSFLSEDMHNAIKAACSALIDEHNTLCKHDMYSPTGQLLNPAPGIEYDVEDMEE